MFWFIFIIDVQGDERAYLVQAKTSDEAYQKMHKRLHDRDPEDWTDDWQDLKRDVVDYGEQVCYGPYDSLPHVK